jgi:hypothetical protein
MSAALQSALAAADAKVRHHKAESKRHRLEARDWAAEREALKARLAAVGVRLVELPPG